MTECTLQDMAPCAEAFNDLVQYAQTNLSEQISHDDNLSPVSVAVFGYEDLALASPLGLNGPWLSVQEKDHYLTVKTLLNDAFVKALTDRQRMSHILSYFDLLLSSSDRNELEAHLAIVMANEAELLKAGEVCASATPKDCTSQGLKALSQIRDYDRRLLTELSDRLR